MASSASPRLGYVVQIVSSFAARKTSSQNSRTPHSAIVPPRAFSRPCDFKSTSRKVDPINSVFERSKQQPRRVGVGRLAQQGAGHLLQHRRLQRVVAFAELDDRQIGLSYHVGHAVSLPGCRGEGKDP